MNILARLATGVAVASVFALSGCGESKAAEVKVNPPEITDTAAKAQQTATKNALEAVQKVLAYLKAKVGSATGDAKGVAEKTFNDMQGKLNELITQFNKAKEAGALKDLAAKFGDLQKSMGAELLKMAGNLLGK